MAPEEPNYSNNKESASSTNQIPEYKFADASERHNQNKESIMSGWQLGKWLDEGNNIKLETDRDTYILEKTLGKGGFGITYLAKEDKTGKQVVIKTLSKEVQDNPNFNKFKEDFCNEAVSLARCNGHRHIVPIIKIILQEQLPCIVMEYINGENLSEVVCKQGVLSQANAISYIQQVGDALSEVHKKGLLHRDVKPQNIIIRANPGDAVLIDFGIARNFRPSEQGPLTSFKSVGYAPIEQYDPNGNQGYHSDVYGLAATLYFVLTRKTPTDAEIRVRKKEDKLEPPNQYNKSISAQVSKAILKGMERYPEERSQTVEEWLALLVGTVPRQSDLMNSDGNGDEAASSQTQKLLVVLVRAALTGLIYGLLTTPIALAFATDWKIWIFGVSWFLFLVGLILALHNNVSNLQQRRIYYLLLMIVTIDLILLVQGIFQIENILNIVLIMSLSSGLVGFFLMLCLSL